MTRSLMNRRTRFLLPYGAGRVGAFISLVVLGIALLAGCEKPESPSDERSDNKSLEGAAAQDFAPDGKSRVKPIALAAAMQAPKPTETMLHNATCLTAECHAKLATAQHVHGPISEKNCNSCHEDDIGGHKFPMKRGRNETCTFCHAVTGNMSHEHKPIKDTGCMTCHDAHASNAKFLLKADNVEQLCQKCHDIPLRKFAHEPFAKGQCTLCHEPHQANNVKLLRGGAGKDHCFTCHTPMKTTFASATSVHKPVLESCTTCHNPHSSDFQHNLRSTVEQTCIGSCHQETRKHIALALDKHDATHTGEACANCHNPHASQQKHLLADRTDALCLKCHDKPLQTPDGRTIANMKPVLTGSQFLHGPVRVGNCSACHDAHGAANPTLLVKNFPQTFYTKFKLEKYDLCFQCHDPNVVLTPKTVSLTNFRNGDKNLHFIHVNRDDKGRSCKTCHEMHGSNMPNHMASDVPFEGSKWAMPIAYEKTATGGGCTPGCHKTRNYERGGAATLILPTTQSTRGAS